MGVADSRLPDAFNMRTRYKTGGLKAPGYLTSRLPDGFPLNVNRSPSVILNLFNLVQFADARHSTSKLGFALA